MKHFIVTEEQLQEIIDEAVWAAQNDHEVFPISYWKLPEIPDWATHFAEPVGDIFNGGHGDAVYVEHLQEIPK